MSKNKKNEWEMSLIFSLCKFGQISQPSLPDEAWDVCMTVNPQHSQSVFAL